MKKINVVILSICFFIFINNVDAYAQNYTDKKIIDVYDKETKQLKAYGFNKYGNLGTGNRDAVTEENMVSLNEKIGGLKIKEYIFSDINTFLVTEDGRLFASGYFIGNGNKKVYYTSFRELKLYNPSGVKVKKIKLIANYNTKFSHIKDSKIKNAVHIQFLTDNSNIYYELNSMLNLLKTDNSYAGYWKHLYLYYDWPLESKYAPYMIYVNNLSKSNIYKAVINKGGKRIKSHHINKKNKTITKKRYVDGVLKTKIYKNQQRSVISKYENSKIVTKRKVFFKNSSVLNGKYSRYIVKVKDYEYIDGKVSKVTIKKRQKNSLKLYLTRDYYRNTKGELKSNEHGKALKVVKKYKDETVVSRQIYFYDSKGKVILSGKIAK